MITQISYETPSEPGTSPNTPGTATAPESTKQREQNTVSKKFYKNNVNMETAIKIPIIDAVEEWLLAKEQKRYTGYLGVMARKLLEHLMRSYVKITASNMQTNKSHT